MKLFLPVHPQTMELQTTTGIGWQISPIYGQLNPVIEEFGDFSYATNWWSRCCSV